jgi:hypothetical protein
MLISAGAAAVLAAGGTASPAGREVAAGSHASSVVFRLTDQCAAAAIKAASDLGHPHGF